MDVQIEKTWKQALESEFSQDYFKRLTDFVRGEYRSQTVYPNPKNIFKAFYLCPIEQVRVVILGQDPYHGAGQAHGLCFSVQEGVSVPPSLQNIYKEIASDVGSVTDTSGNLEHWARQGVLLLNATLTVRAHEAGSHQGKGWEVFTDAVVNYLSDEKEGIVFLLWGKYAQEKGRIIDTDKHLVLTAAHPSPFSAHSGFFECKHFSKTNTYLEKQGQKPIEW
jgi:uracil-DNA glycosylase